MTGSRTISIEAPTRAALVPRGDDFVPGDEWFAVRRASFGPCSIDIGVGPLRFRLDGMSATQAELLATRYRPFVEGLPAVATADVTLHLSPAGVPEFLHLPSGGSETYRMERRSGPGTRDVWSYEFAARLSLTRSEADLALVAGSGHLFERGLENYLRTLTASLILDRGGLLVHSAAVVRGGRGYLFFGPSGSGKTTVTLLSARDTILSDDLAMVLPSDDGFVIAGIPFGMAHHHVPDTNASFPLVALLRLVQSNQVSRQRLTGGRALAELSSCLPFVMQETIEATQALANAGRVLDAVDAWRLSFRKDDAFWQVIEEA
jgi:hypothetical protein